jgi:hypothetical protein
MGVLLETSPIIPMAMVALHGLGLLLQLLPGRKKNMIWGWLKQIDSPITIIIEKTAFAKVGL